MSRREVFVDQLLGRVVLDPAGRRVGHIEELVARPHAGAMVVREFLTGEAGFLSRMSLVTSRSVLFFLHLLAGAFGGGGGTGYAIRWDQLDLSDPEHPRTLVAMDKLTARERE